MNDIKKFGESLLEWYKKEARDLPWRKEPDSYKVLVSELMLQQTRAETVIPYFKRFINEIPDLQTLASTDSEKLLKLWQGLGYYNRVIRLKKAAQIIVEKFGGQIPNDISHLRLLPGIGVYTAGAVASIAFGKAEPAIDGNILRITARLTASTDVPGSPAAKKKAEEFIRRRISLDFPGDFNQALMDLGAGICLPGDKPDCSRCPVGVFCESRRLGIVSVIPVGSIKKERKEENRTVLIVSANGRYALRKRSSRGLLADLWEFPNQQGTLSAPQCEQYLNSLGFAVKEIQATKPAKHVFTHLIWHMTGFLTLTEQVEKIPDWIWADKEEIIRDYSVPSAFKSFIRLLQ